jgi:SAM-dependent methyltransferase
MNSITNYSGLARIADLSDSGFQNLSKGLLNIPLGDFNKYNGWYNHWARIWEMPYIMNGIMTNILPDKVKVLESGSGITTVPLWLALKGYQVCCMDMEPSLALEFEKANNTILSPSSNLEFKVGDMLNIPFENDSFDVVYSISAIEHTGNALKAVEEILRVAKPNALITLTMDIEIANTDSVSFSEFQKIQDLLYISCNPVFPIKLSSPSELLTFNNRTLNKQSGWKLNLKRLLSGFNIITFHDQCIFGFTGRLK